MDEQVWPKMKSKYCEEAELWQGHANMKVGGSENFVRKW